MSQVLFVLTLGLIYWFAFSSDDQKNSANPETQTVKAIEEPGEIPDDIPILGVDITAGPGGDFETLKKAIDYLLKYNNPTTFPNGRKIRLMPKTEINDPLTIVDPPAFFPKSLEILNETGTPIPWKTRDRLPVIHLKDADGIYLTGFDFDAADADTAILLQGRSAGVRIHSAKIKNYKKTGIEFNGTSGLYNRPVRMTWIEFASNAPSSSAIRFTKGSENVEAITIQNCRFIGPCSAGVQANAEFMRWINLKENIFYKTKRGISFLSGNPPAIESIMISNNTFFENETAIYFSKAPTKLSSNFGLIRNLFYNSSQNDFNVIQGYKAENFVALLNKKYSAAPWNWTTRAPSQSGAQAEIFKNRGTQSLKEFKFKNTKPGHEFMKPADGKGKLEGIENHKSYIGAVAP